MIVVDVDVILGVLNGPGSDSQVADALDVAKQLIAPSCLDLEILNSLRKKVLSRQLTERRAAEAIADLATLPLERRATGGLSGRIWNLRCNMTTTAAYVMLAETLDCPFLTRDLRLRSGAAAHTRFRIV